MGEAGMKAHWRQALKLAAGLYAALLWAAASAGESLPALALPLSVRGAAIVDARGQEVLLHGVNASGMEWGAGTRWADKCRDPQWGHRYGCYAPPAPEMYDNLARWGFNLARVPVAWANIESRPGQFNEAYLRDLDAIVDEFARRNIVVIFSMHQWAWSAVFAGPQQKTKKLVHGNGWPVWLYDERWLRVDPVTGRARSQPLAYDHAGQMAAASEFFANRRLIGGKPIQQKLADVWAMLAARYRDRANVIGADLMNEPYGDARGELEAFYARTGSVVHRLAPHWLLAFERSLSNDALQAQAFLGRDGFPREKALYSLHVYAGSWEPNGSKRGAHEKLARALQDAERFGVPYWLGEFHCIMRDDRVEADQTRAFMRFLNRDGAGGNGRMNVAWTYWAYQRDSQPLGGPVGRGPVRQDIVNALWEGGR